jgi:hypothetical protein
VLRIVLLLALLLLPNCGGGGGDSSGFIPPPKSRQGVYYAYYGSCPTCLSQTIDHINMLWEPLWNGEAQVISHIQTAKLPTVLITSPTTDPSILRSVLTDLRNAGVLQYVVGLYPLDEPDKAGWTDEQVTNMVTQQRQVAAEFIELKGIKIAVIYGAGNNRPGIEAYDWVGFDDYDNPNAAVMAEYVSFRQLVKPGQGIILIPGGADPWKNDPRPFYQLAQSDPQVAIMLPFLWADRQGEKGIGSNGMAQTYRPYGLAITQAK